MLKITVSRDRERTTWTLAGRLAGPWVEELRRCWETSAAAEPRGRGSFLVDLQETIFVDNQGQSLLRDMHRRGVKMKARGCLMRAIVEEVAAPASPMVRRRPSTSSAEMHQALPD
jgi:hypothetical protein